ncbi:hypothetical protein VPH35_081660 [Triticum aestivum]
MPQVQQPNSICNQTHGLVALYKHVCVPASSIRFQTFLLSFHGNQSHDLFQKNASTAMSQASAPALVSLSNVQIAEKLTRDNFLPWKAQVLPPVRGALLMGYLDGSQAAPPKEIEEARADKTVVQVQNPAYVAWMTQDQNVLGFLLGSLSREVLLQVMEHTTASSLWAALLAMFASQSRAKVMQLRTQLTNTRKGDSSATAYFTKMKGLADELAAAGKKMDEDDLVSQILQGLDADYNPFVSAISAKTNEQVITLADLYSGLLVAETRLEAQNPVHQQQFSVNLAAKGGRGGSSSNNRGNSSGNSRGGRPDDGRGNYHTNNQRQGNSGGGYGGGYGGGGYNSNNSGYGGHNSGYGGGGYNGGSYGGGGYNNNSRPDVVICQICTKAGHDAYRCWKRFEKNYKRKEKTANTAATSYGVDTNWYIDTGATDHITSELDKLAVRDRYTGTERVHTASGSGAGNGENSGARSE